MAGAACHLGRDDRCARSRERLIDRLAGAGVVDDRPAHALDGLLRSVNRLAVLAAAGNLPERRLFAVAGPVGLAADGVPGGLMLPVEVPPPEHEPVLGPDDLRAN